MKLRPLVSAVLVLASCSARDRAPSPGDSQTTASESQSSAALLSRIRRAAPTLSTFGRTGRVVHAALRVALPDRADAPASIGLDASRTLTIRAVDVGAVAARPLEGAKVFAAARPSMDLLLAAEGDRFEEIRVLHDARAPHVARWALEAREGIVDVRLRGATVEALDAAGHVVVRTEPMFAVDAHGLRRSPSLTLSREGSTWSLSAALDDAGLAYPIVLDPLWLLGASTAFTHTPARVVRLSDGKVYVSGGSSALEVFDPATASFTTLPDVPSTSLNVEAMFATSTEQIHVVANGVHTFDPKTSTWTLGFAPPASRALPAVVQLSDGKILVAGGSNGAGAVSTVEIYDPAAKSWATKASMVAKRAQPMGLLLPSGKIMIAGGEDVATLDSTEIYDPATDAWSAGPAMPVALMNASVHSVPGGSTIFFGGLAAKVPSPASVLYDPATNTMKAGPTLALARANPAWAYVDSRLFVIGGQPPLADSTDSVEVSPSFGAFTKALSLSSARARAAATPLLDGRILVVGGYAGTLGADVTTTELLSSFPMGAACVWGGECASGLCVSGVCCSSTCTGACERCDVAGSVGTCKPAPAKTACGLGAACSGSTLTPRGTCDGAATTCPAATPIACPGALTCADAVSCRNTCTKDDECTTGKCDGATGLCVAIVDAGPIDEDAGTAAPVPEGAPKVLGTAQRCTNASECSTGFCVDGVCCDSACKERCHSCALPGSPGRCSESPLGVDLRAECGPALSCSGTCGAGGVCTNNTKDSQCAPSVCTGPNTGKGAAYCKGRGVTCTPDEAAPFDCGEYACDPAFGACRTSCTSSDGCAPGYLCNLDAKRCEALAVEDDSGCAVGHDGRPGQLLVSLTCTALGLGLGLLRRRRARA